MAISTGEASENLSVYRLRWIGYGFLAFALLDAIHILLTIPTGQQTWPVLTIGQFVERSVVPILGFTLVFFGEFYGRKDSEKIGLRILSWICLLVAILYLLMIPPVVLQSMSVSSQNTEQTQQGVDKALEQRLGQLKQLEDQLSRSKPEELKALAGQLSSLGVTVDPSKPDEVKAQIQARIKTAREQLQLQAQEAKNQAASQTTGLVKNAVKWAFGALITAVLFIYLWLSSKWAR